MTGFIWGSFLLSITLAKAAFQALTVVYPSYKTYKALESRSLQAAQSMLLYWCITAFVNSGKEIVDQVFGTYSNFFIWKLAVLGLKAAPLLLGPERLYSLIVRPFFDANEEKVDAVVDELHELRDQAKSELIPAVKGGDLAGASAAASDIASGVVGQLAEQAAEVVEQLQSKSAELGVVLDKQGAWGLLEQIIAKFETGREQMVDFSAERWAQHGPFITQQAAMAKNKGVELYSQHAPTVRAKIADTYTSTVQPRLQPAIESVRSKYTEQLLPMAQAKKEQAVQLWQTHGGPVRSLYFNQLLPLYQQRLQPFYSQSLRPFVIHSLAPAVYETIVALKDRAVDLLREPSEETRTQRAHHKKTRSAAREARFANASWKKRGQGIKNKWSASWKELEQESAAGEGAAPDQQTAPVADAAFEKAATLTNRHTKEVTDSSLDAAAPAFIPATEQAATLPIKSQPLTESVGGQKEGAAPIDSASKLNSEKLRRGSVEKDTEYSGEARSGMISEPIQ